MINKYPLINKKKIAYRIIDGEAVVLNLENGTFHTYNSLATFIWQQADGKTSIKDIIESVVREFEVDEKQCQEDCVGFIQELVEKELIILKDCKVG